MLSPLTRVAVDWTSGPEQRTRPVSGTQAGRMTRAGAARKTRASLVPEVAAWALSGKPMLAHLSHGGYFGKNFCESFVYIVWDEGFWFIIFVM